MVQDEVKNWRWLSEDPPQVDLSTFKPDMLPEREDPFIIGITLLDFYQEGFDDFVTSTLDRIKEKGFNYIGFAYAPSFFTSSDPLIFTHEPLNTYTLDQLDFVFKEARNRDLKIMLAAGVEGDPEHLEEIEAGFLLRHSDDWYIQLVAEWEEVMVRTAELAEHYQIEIFTPSNQMPFWAAETTEDQKRNSTP